MKWEATADYFRKLTCFILYISKTIMAAVDNKLWELFESKNGRSKETNEKATWESEVHSDN